MSSTVAWTFPEFDHLFAVFDFLKWILPVPILAVLVAIPQTRRTWAVRHAAAFYTGYFIAGVAGHFCIRFVLGQVDGKFRDPSAAILIGAVGVFFFAADTAITFLVGLVFIRIIGRVKLSLSSWCVSFALGMLGALVVAVAYSLFGETVPYSFVYMRWINTWFWGYPLVCALVLLGLRLIMSTILATDAPAASAGRGIESEQPDAQGQ